MHRIVAVALLVASSTALAQEDTAPPAEPKVVYQAVTNIDMGEIPVEAGVVKPELKAVFDVRRSHFNSLIRLRTDFNDEMASSTSQVQ